MTDPFTFIATIPPIKGGITQGNAGDGMQIRLDIPEDQLVSALNVWAVRGKAIEVTVRELTREEMLQAINP